MEVVKRHAPRRWVACSLPRAGGHAANKLSQASQGPMALQVVLDDIWVSVMSDANPLLDETVGQCVMR